MVGILLRGGSARKRTGAQVLHGCRQLVFFNASQCEGLELPTAPETDAEPDTDEAPFEPIVEAMVIIDGYKGAPRIEHRSGRAFYRPSEDLVSLPEPREFVDGESYYATLFHELVHSTGHSKRLDRGIDTKIAPFGSNDYSKEELVAEMGAAFLAASSGISPPTIEQSAAYIESWRKKLKGDKKLVVQAAGAGQKAADWIVGRPPLNLDLQAGS